MAEDSGASQSGRMRRLAEESSDQRLSDATPESRVPLTPDVSVPDSVLSDLSDIAARLDVHLKQRSGPRAFSEQGLSTLLQRQNEYLEDLGLQAIRLARRAHSDVVSAADVDAADQTLHSKRQRAPIRALEPVGGLLAGAGISQLYTVLSATGPAPSKVAYLLAFASTVLGIAMLAYAIARD